MHAAKVLLITIPSGLASGLVVIYRSSCSIAIHDHACILIWDAHTRMEQYCIRNQSTDVPFIRVLYGPIILLYAYGQNRYLLRIRTV